MGDVCLSLFDVVEQAKKVEVLSPKVPQTRCRTSTRQRKTTETEKVASTRTTIRRGTKKVAGGVEESRNEILKTPAISSSRKKAVETSSCRNVSSQLNECEEEADEEGVVDQKVEPGLMYTRRKVDAVKKGSVVQKIESTVVTEKKTAETRVKKDSGKAVKIDSFMDDEVDVESEETNVESENTNAAVEDICAAFEKLNVLVVEKSDCSPVIECSPVLEEAVDFEAKNETSNPCEDLKVEEKLDLGEKDSSEAKDEPKPESNVISSPCEDESSEQNLDLGAEKSDASEAKDETLVAPEEDADSLFDDNASLESEMNNEVQEIDEDMEQVSKNTDNESFDVSSTIKFEDLKPELFTETNANEKADSGVPLNEEKSQFFVSAPCFPTRATPIKNATPFKNTSIVTDDKENIVVEGKKSKKEIDATAYSIRQLRKQIKALTLKSSGNEDASKEAVATTRPALQIICENQMVGGETKN
ncbi:hypothetical protein CTI12_AA205940 [Artemisia annua]|uniref:Uncharacterized protein n=1 Tax=Artemisia annua TaxID=35608 RepID=A0A2U1P0P4_ARTAN|nr:hypothetical protein CTI12_AA205940 [Artemisia annua]